MKDWKIYHHKLEKYAKPVNLKVLIAISRIILTIPVLYLLYIFCTKTVWKLATVKH